MASGAVWTLATSQKVVAISIDELGAWTDDRVSQRGQRYPKPDLEGSDEFRIGHVQANGAERGSLEPSTGLVVG